MSADPAERKYREALLLLSELERAGFAARLAGGCVRDRCMGLQPADYDVATTAEPTAVLAIFKAAGKKAIPTGLEHGTVTVVYPTGPIEVTTLRCDVATDGRHASVRFGTSFEEDAARRDFTINAMFEDASGKITDYFGGRADIAARTLRFVGEPSLRLGEDYLRILRLFRFWSRLGFLPAPGTLDAVAEAGAGLSRISQERITSELWKTLAGASWHAAILAMQETGVLAIVLPELAHEKERLQSWPETAADVLAKASSKHRALLVLTSLLAAQGTSAATREAWTSLGERLRLPGIETKRLALAGELLTSLQSPIQELAQTLDVIDRMAKLDDEASSASTVEALYLPLLHAAAALLQASGASALASALEANATTIVAARLQFEHRRTAVLPIDGSLLQKRLGLPPGPVLGQVLADLKRAFRNGEWESRDEGFAWLARQEQLPSQGPR